MNHVEQARIEFDQEVREPRAHHARAEVVISNATFRAEMSRVSYRERECVCVCERERERAREEE